MRLTFLFKKWGKNTKNLLRVFAKAKIGLKKWYVNVSCWIKICPMLLKSTKHVLKLLWISPCLRDFVSSKGVWSDWENQICLQFVLGCSLKIHLHCWKNVLWILRCPFTKGGKGFCKRKGSLVRRGKLDLHSLASTSFVWSERKNHLPIFCCLKIKAVQKVVKCDVYTIYYIFDSS